jgi:galactonate dehydratase
MLVRIVTDDGTEGVGEAQAPIAPEVSQAVVRHLYAPVLLGEDPIQREVLWSRLYDLSRDRGHSTGFALDALSAVDIALWDLCGKALNLSVAELMGGRYRDRLRSYVSGVTGRTREERQETIRQYRAQGWSAFKLIIGQGVKIDIAEAQAAREAAGEDATLMADAHWMYDVPDAIAVGRGLERLGFDFFESPLVVEDVRGHAAVASALDMAVALGEPYRSRYELKPFLDSGGCEVAQPDIGRAGGLTECRRIAALADTYHVPIAPHQGLSLGLYIAAAIQLAAAIPNFRIMEFQPTMQAWAERMLTDPPRFEGGYVEVPRRPGLGTNVRWDELRPYLHD